MKYGCGDKNDLVKLLEKLAEVCFKQKWHCRGVEYLQKAINIGQAVGNKDSERRNTHNLANAFYNNEEYSNATEWYWQTLEMMRQIGDEEGERNILESLVEVHNKTGNHDMTIRCRRESWEVTEKIGKDYFDQGNYEKAIECFLKILEEDGDRNDENRKMYFSSCVGNAYFNSCQYPKAIKFYKDAQVCANKIEDKDEERSINKSLGDAYHNVYQNENAIEYYKKALEIAQKCGDKNEEKTIQESLAEAFHNNGNHKEIIERYEAALDIVQQLKDKHEERRIHQILVEAYYNNGEIDKAVESCHLVRKFTKEIGDVYLTISYFLKAVQIAERSGNKDEERKSYKRLGKAYVNQGHYKKAEECFLKALKISQLLGLDYKDVDLLEQLNNVYQKSGDYRKIIECGQKCLNAYQQLSDKRGELNSLERLGITYSKTGNFVETNECYENVLKISRDVQDKPAEGRAHMALGINHNATGQYRKAIESHIASVKIAQQLGDRQKELRAFINLGITLGNVENLEKARGFLQKALTIAQELGDENTVEGEAHQELANIYCKMGKYPDAMSSFTKALEMAENLHVEKNQFDSLIGLGFIHRKIGKDKKSIESCQQALRIAENLGNKRLEGTAYYYLGLAYYKISGYVKPTRRCKCGQSSDKHGDEFTIECSGIADEVHEEPLLKVLRIVKELGEKDGERQACFDLGNAYLRAKKYGNKAVEYHQMGLSIAQEMQENEQSIQTHQEHLKIAQELENKDTDDGSNSLETTPNHPKLQSPSSLHRWVTEKASQFFCQSILAQDETRQMVVHQDDINTSLSNMYSHRHTYLVDCLLDLNQFKTALLVSDIGKAKALQNLMRKHVNLTKHINSEEIITKWMETIKCSPSSPRNESLLHAASSNVVRSLHDGSVIAYSFDCRKNLHINVVSSKGVVHKLWKTSNVTSSLDYFDTIVAELRNSFVSTGTSFALDARSDDESELKLPTDFTEMGEEEIAFTGLFKERLRQIPLLKASTRNATDEKRLRDVYSLDSSVHRVNYNVNRNTERGRIFHMVCSVYGLDRSQRNITLRASSEVSQFTDFNQFLSKLYSHLISPVQEHLTGDKLVIVPQGSLFSLPFAALLDSNNSHLCEKYSIQVTPALHTLNLSLEIPLQKLGPALFVGNPRVGTVMVGGKIRTPTDLPNSRIEAEECGTFFNARALVEKEATKQTVLNKMKNASVVHIAAHGHPAYAEILLAPNVDAPTPATASNYLLMPEDVVNCTLNARLVVLSCCHSGRGQISAEGVVGIARAFLGAGARSVLATLWAIPDEETRTFMKMFYNSVCQGHSVCVALQRTMTTLKEQYPIAHWAAFEILGEDITFTKEDIEEIRRQSSQGTKDEE